MEKVAFRSGNNYGYSIQFCNAKQYVHPEITNITVPALNTVEFTKFWHRISSQDDLPIILINKMHDALMYNVKLESHIMAADSVKIQVRFIKRTNKEYDYNEIIRILNKLLINIFR